MRMVVDPVLTCMNSSYLVLAGCVGPASASCFLLLMCALNVLLNAEYELEMLDDSCVCEGTGQHLTGTNEIA